jgi:dipeptidyl aminopeptidase/acylaminoacyl peptidase
VTLPHEAHGYLARESNMHVVAETLNWLDYYVKSAEVRGPTSAPR